jgi:hypothetical protein
LHAIVSPCRKPRIEAAPELAAAAIEMTGDALDVVYQAKFVAGDGANQRRHSKISMPITAAISLGQPSLAQAHTL